ncbi:MAG: hypothetical protein RQ760_05950 [Sedimentisphaerales bacterium]|nr:hypothetical protein [Sedimentisphaerales bacterium]
MCVISVTHGNRESGVGPVNDLVACDSLAAQRRRRTAYHDGTNKRNGNH